MTAPKIYQNPVYDQYMADPFVLHDGDRYYAYGTAGLMPDGRQFRVLESDDLAHWQMRGGALVPTGHIAYWAPEVAVRDGVYYMYYSSGGETGLGHQLHVATSQSPLGPFTDKCVLMPDEPFAIDAHPFRDTNGDWYLFYCRDFLTLDGDYRVGTGIVVDRLLDDMTTLAGDPQLVIRPFAGWQLYEAQRSMYGAIYDWHTIEGAATRIHEGHYYCFYSGGAWQRENYGIDYVVADQPLGPYCRPQNDAPILRSLPGQVIGPGHNSFTESVSGQEYIVYHGWDTAMTARLMRIDRLEWDGNRPVIAGPTTTLQPLK